MPTQRVTLGLKSWTLGNSRGGGSFSKVFEATDDATGELVAIKILPIVYDARRERIILPIVADVPNVMPVLDHGEDGATYVVVMPLAERSLQDDLDALGGSAMELGAAVEVLADVATALAGVQDMVAHRDIKPANILRFAGHWHLADFGISRLRDVATAPDTMKDLGSEEYKAPERFLGRTATTASDVYSLGILAFELLTGRLPFNGPEFAHQHTVEDVPPLIGVPDHIAGAVAAAVQKSPEARPTASRLRELLREPPPDSA